MHGFLVKAKEHLHGHIWEDNYSDLAAFSEASAAPAGSRFQARAGGQAGSSSLGAVHIF